MSFTFELKGVPVQFANAIRRILLNETPTVELAVQLAAVVATLTPNAPLVLAQDGDDAVEAQRAAFEPVNS
jgi:hypothetical protein